MKTKTPDIYRGRDPREIPVYSAAQAARYIRMPVATLRTWVYGRHYERKNGLAFFTPPIQLSDPEVRKLSFWNLIEAHVLKSLRVEHSVSMEDVRLALDYAEKEMGIENLLRRKELRTGAGKIFIDKYGELINASQSGQIAMKRMLEDYLRSVQWGADSFATRFFPYPVIESTSSRIVIDPTVGFGRPVIQPGCISTAIIVSRVDAGEDLRAIAHDYDLDLRAIEEAVVYERAA